MLQNECLVEKIGVDTAENEPPEVRGPSKISAATAGWSSPAMITSAWTESTGRNFLP